MRKRKENEILIYASWGAIMLGGLAIVMLGVGYIYMAVIGVCALFHAKRVYDMKTLLVVISAFLLLARVIEFNSGWDIIDIVIWGTMLWGLLNE